MSNQINNIPQDDTRYGIFVEIFHIKVPKLHMTSVEELQYFGIPTSGLKQFDEPNEIIDVMWPISKMVECHHGGGSIYFPREDTILEVYNRISLHLNAWKKEIVFYRSLNVAPIEDLRKLDAFANSIYEHAKYHITDDFVSEFENMLPDSIKKINSVLGLLSSGSEKPKETPTARNVRVVDSKNRNAPQVQQEPERVFQQRVGIDKFITEQKEQGNTSLDFHAPTVTNDSRTKFLGGQKLSYKSFMKRGE